jgi:hypothetical protein
MGAITRRRAAMSSQEVSPRASFALIEPEMKPQSPPAQVDAEWDLVTHGSNAPRDLAEERSEKRDPWFSAEGNDQGLALPHAHSKWLYRCSHLCLASALVACATSKWDFAMVVLGAGITSLNYWRRPDYGWRRYFDIVYIQAGAVNPEGRFQELGPPDANPLPNCNGNLPQLFRGHTEVTLPLTALFLLFWTACTGCF